MADSPEPKKQTVRITLPPRVSPNPTEAAANRRDTVRINLPSRPPANGIVPNRPASASPPATNPTLPASPRPPVAQPPTPPAPPVTAPTFLPLQSTPASTPRPPSSASVPFSAAKAAVQATAMPATETGSVSPGPKKETARITVLSDPPKASGSVQMKKTQPLISVPEVKAPVAPVTVAPKEAIVRIGPIPMPLCWTLLGASAVILLIQIWNYLS